MPAPTTSTTALAPSPARPSAPASSYAAANPFAPAPDGRTKRAVRALARTLAHALTLLAFVTLVTLLASRVVGDPSVPWQFAFWIPTWAYILSAAGAIAASALLARVSRRRIALDAPRAGPRPARVLRRIALLGIVGASAYLLVHDWRVANLVRDPLALAAPTIGGDAALAPDPQSDPQPLPPRIRVANWNPNVTFMEPFEDVVANFNADVALLANSPALVDWTLLRDGFQPARDAARAGNLTIISRYRILRWGATSLNIDGARSQVHRWKTGGAITIDRGQALWAELDTRDPLGAPIVVWFVDLPSDIFLSRADSFRQARQTIDAFLGPSFQRTTIDADAPISHEILARRFGPSLADGGFPPPDLIIGDFNTPRHSPSIRAMLPHDVADAFDQAGAGPMTTWPVWFAMWAIDHAYVGSRLTTTKFEVRPMNAGAHHATIVEVAPRR